MTTLRILDILEDTTVDGPGFRTAVYGAGCAHRCPGCHNPQSWETAAGDLFSVEEVLERIRHAEFADVTFSGGDPLMQPEGFTELARRIKAQTDKAIWCYTGYTFEQIAVSERLARILPYIDVLVDGPFVERLRDESLRFRGSRNQRIIRVRESLLAGKVVLDEEYMAPDEDRLLLFPPVVQPGAFSQEAAG